MPDSEYPVGVVSGVPVVTTPEEVDITNAGELRIALLTAADHGPAPLVVDMTRTEFCDTAGIHALVAAHKRAEATGYQLRLVVSSPNVVRIFEITGLDRVIPRFTSLEEAVAPAPPST